MNNNNHQWYKDNLLLFPLTLETYTYEEVLQRVGSFLYQNGYVKDSYTQAIIEREKVYPTGLPTKPGVAIPHTDSIHTKELAVAVAILDKPVQFYEMGSNKSKMVDVSIVFALSVPNPKEVIQRLQLLFSVIQDPSFLSTLMKYKDRTEISSYLNERLNIQIVNKFETEQKSASDRETETLEERVIIQHPIGLHARPASLFVQTAKQFRSEITVVCGERKANAKSILNVLQLGAKQGSTLLIQARGEDKQQAIKTLKDLVESNFGETLEESACQ